MNREQKQYGLNSTFAIQMLTVGIICSVLTGCQTIPADISGWNQSTKDVTGAVTEGFRTATDVNGDIARRLEKFSQSKPEFSEPAKRYASVAKALEGRADDYEKLFGAINDYSASLAAIAHASEKSQQAVDAVAGSLNQLIGAIGGTSLAGAGFELGKMLANEIIKIKAAKDFSEAVQQADPVIGQVSELLVKDLADLQRTVGETKDEAIRAAVEDPNKKQLEYRNALERRRADLQTAIKTAIAPGPISPGATPSSTTSLLNNNDVIELGKVEQYLRDADAWYIPLKSELDRSLASRTKSEELTIQTSRAVKAWRDSHASLAAAVKERRVPESGRLAALAIRIRDLATELKREK